MVLVTRLCTNGGPLGASCPRGPRQVVEYALRLRDSVGSRRTVQVALAVAQPEASSPAALSASSKPHHVWVSGYANCSSSYIPSELVMAEGGYEGGEK